MGLAFLLEDCKLMESLAPVLRDTLVNLYGTGFSVSFTVRELL